MTVQIVYVNYMALIRRQLYLILQIMVTKVFVCQVLQVLKPSTGRSEVTISHMMLKLKKKYNSNVDKKRIIGLLVKRNKVKNLVIRGVKIATKIYYSTRKVFSGDVADEQLTDYSSEVSLDFDRNATPSVHIDKSGGEVFTILLVVVVHLNIVMEVLFYTDTNTYCPESDRQMLVQVNGNHISDDQIVQVFTVFKICRH